ncbi:MAG: hypothetical protein R2716_01615 [Microthrixaceae bacterium]
MAAGEMPEGDPGPPDATFTDVREQLSVPLGATRADGVLVWITDLGDPVPEGAGAGPHRVEIREVVVEGTAIG